MNSDIAELCEAGALQRSLDGCAAGAGRGEISVAFASGSAVMTAGALGSPARRAPIGCLAKLLTATLALAAVRRGSFTLDTCVAALLEETGGALHGVTVRHLLEHRHGLDDSLLATPRRASGFSDRAEFLARVAALERWSSPGAAYSYGNAGAWLLAAILERVYRRAFGSLVRDELLTPAGVAGSWSTADVTLCPALGAGLTLSAEELVRFCRYAVADDGTLARAPIAPLPGWHPLERGICLGWKSGGAGWLGHQSVWPGASTFVRVHPQRKLALAVVAREQAAALVALGVFGKHFAELFDGRSQLPAEARAPLPTGVYAQAARAVSITRTLRGLVAEAWERDAHGARRGACANAALVRAGGVLFAQPASELVPYVEAVSNAPGDVWLWNGRVVLRPPS